MTTISQLLAARQYGLPKAHEKLQEACDGRTADLAKDRFSHTSIELPIGVNTTLRKGDWVAVFSNTLVNSNLCRLALWSLLSRRKVWEIELGHYSVNPYKCALSSSGIVLLSPHYENSAPHRLVCNGMVTVLPALERQSFHLSGSRVFSSLSANSPKIDEHETFFSELDCDTGFFKWTKQLLNLQKDTIPVYAHNDEFWVRLSVIDLPRIEVINLTHRSSFVRKFLLDMQPSFSSACIVQNLLIYGKNYQDILRRPIKHSINIFDLVKGTVLATYPTNGKSVIPKTLTATDHFVAWSEYLDDNNLEVKFLNPITQEVAIAKTINQKVKNFGVDLHLSGSVLIVSYYQRESLSEVHWHRDVIDLVTSTTLQAVRYQGLYGGTCTYNNGILLIAAESPNEVHSKMYIESFIQDYNIQEKSQFRT